MNEFPKRSQLKIGMLVEIHNNGKFHKGYIQKILSGQHTDKGVKVELHSGETGRVQRVITKEEVKKETFIFYNRILFSKSLFSIYDNENRRYFTLKQSKNNGSSKHAFLFESKEDAEACLQKMNRLGHSKLSVRAIPKNKEVYQTFKIAEADVLIINHSRNVSVNVLEKLERKLKSLN